MLGTANLHLIPQPQIPQPQIPQNCKRCSATANTQVCDRFAVTFRTSATANAHCTSENLDSNIYCYFVLVMIFFCRSNFAVAQTLTSKKKVINTRTQTSNPKNKSVHFQAVLLRNRQHCLLLCGFAVNFSFFHRKSANICGKKLGLQIRK